jgi:hypothetical protein
MKSNTGNARYIARFSSVEVWRWCFVVGRFGFLDSGHYFALKTITFWKMGLFQPSNEMARELYNKKLNETSKNICADLQVTHKFDIF